MPTVLAQAQFSPNGCWVASGDASGKVRIWSYDNPEHVLKLEVQGVGGGEVKDLDWDPESQRVVAVGEGQGTNAKVFMRDTGTSLGELNGHGKRVISTAYRPCRPFRLVTASEDTRTVFYHGPPFRLEHSNAEHTNWVNTVRFSPDGALFATASSDRRVVLYAGATGHPVGDLDKDGRCPHAGSVYSLAFNPDGSRLATASADKTIKVWATGSREMEVELPFSRENELGEMQTGVLWLGPSALLSLSLSGDLSVLDVSPGKAARRNTLQGHQVSVTSLAVDLDGEAFYTASYDGVVLAWEARTGSARRLGGPVPRTVNSANHTGKVTGLALVRGGRRLRSVGFDDRLRTARLEVAGQGGPTGTYEGDAEVVLPGQPVTIARAGGASDLVTVICQPAVLVVYRDGALALTIEKLPCTPSALAMFGEDEVAVGGEDCKVYVYALGEAESASKGAKAVLGGPRGAVSALAYSPGGGYLAVGDSNREITIFERSTVDLEKGREEWDRKVSGQWVHHTSRITALAWSPSGRYLASGSSDTHIMVWSLDGSFPRSRVATFESAHKDGVTVLDWLTESDLISSGNDAVICVWDVASATRA